METESLLRERALLPEEQEALKGKYKKALQELTRLLKVNKSLKDSLDSHAQALQERLAQQQAEDQQRQLAEIEVYRGQIEHYKDLLQDESSRREQLQLELSGKEEELVTVRAHSQQLQAQLRKIEEESVGKGKGVSKDDEYPSLRERISQYLQVCRQRDLLSQQCSQLKTRVSELTLALVQQRQRCRSQIFTRETQLLRSKQSQFEKMRTMQSKYQLLESELNNYKSAEKYFEEEANSLLDEETVYNSIRQQITRISQDFSKYQLESSQLLLKKREEDAERNRKILELEREVSRLKGVQERLATKEKEGELDRADKEELKAKINQLQAERDQQTGKNHVLQALAITDKHRVHPSISERIRQFETRVKVLLEQGSPAQLGPQAAAAHQVVVLKGCVQELSEMLRQAKRKEDHLNKRHQHYKQKLATAEEAYRTKIGEFKAKIRDYDVLVGKLYAALQEKLKERIPVEIQRQFNSAIGHYEQKIVQMSEQIIKLRAKVTQMQGAISGLQKTQEVAKQVVAIQAENQDYKEIISELSVRVNQLQQHAERTAETEQQLREKDRIIDSLAKEVSALNTVVAKGKQRETASATVVQEYERQVVRFRDELQQKQRISSNLSRNSIDTASLIEKVNYLQYELDKARKPDPTPKPDDYVISLESKLSAQSQQIAEYKAEIERLYAQLRTEKEEKRSSAADQFSQIRQLQKQISDWELRVLALQEEFHGREAQYKDQLEAARFQSRSLIEQLNSKHTEMMGYYEELTRKTQLEAAVSRLPELERYVMELQRKNHEIIERSSIEANQLNASILALRTTNLALRNELQNKQDAVNELKHQLFNAQLRSQKERPNPSMSASFSGSIIEGEREREKEGLLVAMVLLGVQVEALRGKKEELEAMYHEDLDKYRQALKQLETRQMELCNSLQLSSQVHEGQQLQVQGGRQVESRLQLSEQAISHLSHDSNTFLSDPHKPLQATIAIRSHEHYPENPPSNASIQASPKKRRGVTVKKIG